MFQLNKIVIGFSLSFMIASLAVNAAEFKLSAVINYLLEDQVDVFIPPEDCPTSKISVCYDVVYVRQIRLGDNQNTTWPEIFHPGRMNPGADLMLLYMDGTEEVLVDCTDCGVTGAY